MSETAVGGVRRVVAVRLEPGEDLLGGIQEACERHGIKHGAVVSGIGSLRKANFCTPVELPETKFGYGYSEPTTMEGPIELIAVSGVIGEGEKGETLLHIHCCFGDRVGNSYAGHLIEGNPILATADLVIEEFSGIRMERRFNQEMGLYLVHPMQASP